jgi:transposase-like protein
VAIIGQFAFGTLVARLAMKWVSWRIRHDTHKRRNVIGYLPVGERDAVDIRLAKAFADPDPNKGLAACQALARQLEARHPDAAASLREGLEEMFTIARLGVTGRLRRTLTNTNTN